MNKNESNIDLFKQVSKGNELAFEKLYRLYFPRLYAFSLKIINDADLAKDVVQNVFIKLWENHDSFKHEHPEAFLYKMIRNASLNYIRHLKVVDNLKVNVKDRFLGEELYHIDLVRDEPYLLIQKELQEKVVDILNGLPPKCKEVFSLSRIDGLKNQEIADQLGISIKAVEKHISKALSIYRGRFADYLPLSVIMLILDNIK